MSNAGKVAVIGVGDVPTGCYPERSPVETAMVSSLAAIRNAGIDKNEIDAILTTASLCERLGFEVEMSTGRMVEELGLRNKVKINTEVFSGGSSSCDNLRVAKGLIETEQAEVVLCVHSDKLGSGATVAEIEDIFRNAAFSPEWEVPFGINGVILTDWLTRRYLHETGATLEEISAVIVSNKKWGHLNPNAAFRDLVTLDDIAKAPRLTSLLTASHFQTYMDGGCAFIVMSAESAKRYAAKPVYVLGEGSRVSQCLISVSPDILGRESYAAAAKDAFAESGLTPKDMDFAQIYECNAAIMLAAFEEMGFSKRGEGAAFFAAGHGAPGGRFPVCTNGGLLVQGHSGAGGGYALLIEAVRQLKGEAGDRQIPSPRYGLYTGTGGAFANAVVTVLGTQIPS